MSQSIAEPEIEPPVTLPERPHLPHAWQGVALGLAGAIVLTCMAMILAVQFIRNRPLDLRPATKGVGATIVRLAQNQHVPKRYIEYAAPELRRAEGAYFYHAELTLRVPDEINRDGLTRVLEQSLWRDGVFLANSEPRDDATVLHFVVSSHEVATIFLKPEFRYPDRPAAATQPAQGSAEPQAHSSSSSAPAPPETVSASDRNARPSGTTLRQSTGARVWTPPAQTEIGPATPAKTQVAQGAIRLAIIVDDGGYGGAAADIILGLSSNLTLSILPYTPFGTSTAQEAADKGFEVLLHMPMENGSHRLTFQGQIDTSMTLADIRRLTHAALSDVPGAVGINNHTGSKFTANSEALERFMKVLQDTDLFFVDSRTTPDSKAFELAHRFGIPTAERTLFLDNDDAPDAIRARFRELMQLARRHGRAIGICHFRPNTALILREMLPELNTNGIQLVPVSQLVR